MGTANEKMKLVPARCRSWKCPDCGPKNARKLADRLALVKANKFLTLTIKADGTRSEQELLDVMNAAWRQLWKRVKRRYPNGRWRYVRVVELTKKRTPHLHILCTLPFIPQRWLARQWGELTGSYIVDIRAIKSARGLAHYLSKYVAKSVEGVAGRRKYGATVGALPPAPRHAPPPGSPDYHWQFAKGQFDHVTSLVTQAGAVNAGDYYNLPPHLIAEKNHPHYWRFQGAEWGPPRLTGG